MRVLILATMAIASTMASNIRTGSDNTFEQAFAKISKQTGHSFLGDKALNTYKTMGDKDKHMSALEVASTTTTKVGAMNNCENCVYVLERIKQGYQYLLPSICVEIFSKENAQGPYAVCHEVLASLSVWGNNVRHWLHYGCYKAESYGAMELIRPCPSHIICSQMADFKKKAFCKKQDQEKLAAGR
jgi:hypothetical protein